MPKQRRSKRAITPILATLLLIVIAVAAIVVTYAWIMTYMGHLTGQAGVILYPANVRFYGANNQIEIDVQDKGTSDAHIIQIYAGNSTSNLQPQTSASPLPTVCVAGSIVPITFNYNWTAGTTYYFKVVAQEQTLGPWAEQAQVS
jgi:flagellin-like protein